MRPFQPGLLLLVFASFAVSASAQTISPSTPSATSDPQAVALIQKALAALTGGASLTDVTLTGSARRIAGSDDETGTATVMGLTGGYSKVTLNLPSGLNVEIRNPSGTPIAGALPPGTAPPQTPQPVGAWSGPDGVLHGEAPHNLVTDATWFFPALTLGRIANPPYVLSYIGSESFGGQQAIHVQAAQQVAPALNGGAAVEIPPLIQHLSQLDVYFDPSTLLPLALVFTQHPDTQAFVDIPIQIQFSNYQNAQGAQVPHRVQKFINNGLVLDLQFENVVLNSGLAASIFQLQ